jgi:hypothetical protein
VGGASAAAGEIALKVDPIRVGCSTDKPEAQPDQGKLTMIARRICLSFLGAMLTAGSALAASKDEARQKVRGMVAETLAELYRASIG